jgi:hypothetical protein
MISGDDASDHRLSSVLRPSTEMPSTRPPMPGELPLPISTESRSWKLPGPTYGCHSAVLLKRSATLP